MPLRPSGKPAPRRGYLLMEVMIGGAMAAVIMAGIFTLIADARGARIAAARDVLASQHVLDKMEELRNMSPPTTTGSPETLPGPYTRSWTVGPAVNEVLSTPSGNVTITSRVVTVTVTYRSRLAASGTRTTTATTQVYQ